MTNDDDDDTIFQFVKEAEGTSKPGGKVSRNGARFFNIIATAICVGAAVLDGMTGHAGFTALMAAFVVFNAGMFVMNCLPRDIDEYKERKRIESEYSYNR